MSDADFDAAYDAFFDALEAAEQASMRPGGPDFGGYVSRDKAVVDCQPSEIVRALLAAGWRPPLTTAGPEGPVYLVVQEDRHYDVAVRPYRDRAAALAKARAILADDGGSEEGLTPDMVEDGWILFGPYVRVIERELA